MGQSNGTQLLQKPSSLLLGARAISGVRVRVTTSVWRAGEAPTLVVVEVVMEVPVPLRAGSAREDVEGDVAGGGAVHLQLALAQPASAVAAVTEGTQLLTVLGVPQSGGGRSGRVF